MSIFIDHNEFEQLEVVVLTGDDARNLRFAINSACARYENKQNAYGEDGQPMYTWSHGLANKLSEGR